MKNKKFFLFLQYFILFFSAFVFFFSRTFFSSLDLFFSENIFKIWNPFLNYFFIFISQFLLDSKTMCFFAIIIFVLGYRNKKIKSFLFVGAVGCVAVLSEGLKYFFKVTRPVNSLIAKSSYSFPSSHASISLVFFVLIYFYFSEKCKNKKLFLVFNTFLIFLVGFSRIYLNVHYFSDVIAGYFLSIFVLSFLSILVRFFNFNFFSAPYERWRIFL